MKKAAKNYCKKRKGLFYDNPFQTIYLAVITESLLVGRQQRMWPAYVFFDLR